MTNTEYLSKVLDTIETRDSLHAYSIRKGIKQGDNLDYLIDVVCGYFVEKEIPIEKLVNDYLLMIADIRSETALFLISGKYSCANQKEAFDKFYSNSEVMSYYMNGLLLSTILWRHHFDLLGFFMDNMDYYLRDKRINILDVGSGHGINSRIVADYEYDIDSFDVVDMSESSLEMAKSVISLNTVNYICIDAMIMKPKKKYDLIILGEILEHLDDPLSMLKKMRTLLNDDGVIWVTVPMNAPTIDHVYLFKSQNEVFDLIEDAGLITVDSTITHADNLTSIVGTFCKRYEIRGYKSRGYKVGKV